MRISKIFFLIFLVYAIEYNQAHAQFGYFEDALRFSQFRSTGSARVNGLGGAQVSLGGDISNIHMNPAGLGFFRRSEFSMTPTISNWQTESIFLGQSQENRVSNFALPNIGVVISNPKGPLQSGAFRGGSFGISFNRSNFFNTDVGYFSDVEGDISIIDFFLRRADGIPESQIQNAGLTGLAYETFLINPITVDGNGNPIANPTQYDSFVLGFPFQDELIITTGRTSQTTFSYGANFYNKLFLGAGVMFTAANFRRERRYTEEFFNEPLITTTTREFLETSGGGVSLNFGAIYKPIDQVNLGFNFQSPTWYRFNEQYDASMVNVFDNFFFEPENITLGREEARTDIILGTYNLNTPLRVSGGATFFVGKNGFITADVDFLDYTTSRINSRDFNPSDDNLEIRRLYGQVFNYRLGGEFRHDIFRLRGGYGFYGDPFANSNDFDRSMQQFSGGAGIRLKRFYVDFSYSVLMFDQLYNSFPFIENGFNIGPFTEIRNRINSGSLTFGINF
ncbi:OmpP1/FadL family transporter [Mongoliitalea daihaiensis]|uniref:OmpP1/FadL family transporter n=1 Tax=Mongoliitalea daihaiensis TaxID=2782006 RepID=UPI001F3D70A7|nr:long-chain fatty acid transporter [Mongoliitalea daihaiensis]